MPVVGQCCPLGQQCPGRRHSPTWSARAVGLAQIPRNLPLRPLQAAIFCSAGGHHFPRLRQGYRPLSLPSHTVILSPRLLQAEWAMEAGCLHGAGRRFPLLQ